MHCSSSACAAPSTVASPHKEQISSLKGLGKMQLWLTHGEQQLHPISQMCLFITVLFLGGSGMCTQQGFSFSKSNTLL